MRTLDDRIRRIAILGAGRVGTALARALIDAGYGVTIAGSGDPAIVDMIVSTVAPGARAAWAEDAVSDADMVVLALPLHRIRTVDATMLDGRLVVDAMNYWPPVDGHIAEFDGAMEGSSSVVQALLPGARVVKSFNHTGYHDLEPDRRPSRHPDRRAMAVAGDDERDVAMVAQVIERIGMTPSRSAHSPRGACSSPGKRRSEPVLTLRRSRRRCVDPLSRQARTEHVVGELEEIVELGIGAFGDASRDPVTGSRIVSEAQAIRNVVESIVLAEEVGLDWFGVGEHHTPEFPVSAAAPVLAAAAALTSRIKLSSAVTVLSTDDPVRVYQQFATVDAISGGRVEMIPGRGSSVESFPLFGYDLQDYDRLFAERLDLLIEVNRSAEVSWRGSTRPALTGQYVPPRAEQGPIPIWLGVGGNPGSIIRAAQLGLPMATGVLGGSAIRSAANADLYRSASAHYGNSPQQTLVMLGSPGFVSENGDEARATWWPHWHQFMKTVGQQRGFSPPTRESYDRDTGPHGGLLVGSPEEIAERILLMHEHWGHVRQYIHIDMGAVPQRELLHAIELFGTQVRPIVQRELGSISVDALMGRSAAA